MTFWGENVDEKVVQYSGSKEEQTVQFDAKGSCLNDTAVSCNTENGKFDICVTYDRLWYTGKQVGFTSDSQGRVILADNYMYSKRQTRSKRRW